jgi:iron complex transport system substrate-binding protein
MRLSLFILFIGCFAVSCKQKETYVTQNIQGTRIPIQYAKGFTITQYTGYKEIVVRNPLDTSKIIQQYRLINDSQFSSTESDVLNIQVPINDLACLSTTHLGFIEALGLSNKLIAFSGTKYIYSATLTQLVKEGKIKEAGLTGGLDLELLVSLQPDIIMSYQTGDESYDHFEKMKSMQLKPVVNNEYLELTPLGQAECIKFFAAFFNVEDKAAHLFDSVVSNYNAIKLKASAVAHKPTVFTGLAYKNEWTVPGGNSFAASYLRDAGANYLWSSNQSTGNFALSFEEILTTANQAEFWINAGSSITLKHLLDLDIRNSHYSAYLNKKIYNNYARVNTNGGNDYWESAVVYPDRVLSDLVKIFHPELNQGSDLYYYIHLK